MNTSPQPRSAVRCLATALLAAQLQLQRRNYETLANLPHARPAPPDAGSHVINLAADKAANRARSRRRRARAQHDTKAPTPSVAELLPADDTATPLPAGPGSPGE